MLPARNSTLATPRSAASAVAWAMMSGERSRPVTFPGATSPGEIAGDAARPAADVEHVTSPGVRCGITNAAEFSAVLEAWARTTDSWWPCVYTSSSGCCVTHNQTLPRRRRQELA